MSIKSKMIACAWSDLRDIVHNQATIKHADKLLRLTLDEANRRNNYRAEQPRTIRAEAQYFAVRDVARYINSQEEQPNPQHYLFMKHSVFQAYAIAYEFRKEIFPWAQRDDVREICSWEYSNLILRK